MRRCDFLDNVSASRGAAVSYVFSVSPTFEECEFHGNMAGTQGGAIFGEGGSVTTLTKCVLSFNQAGSAGGGIFLQGGAALEADFTEILNNIAPDGPDGSVSSGALLHCCTIDPTQWSGNITIDDQGCSSPVDPRSWGRTKSLFR